MATPAFTEYIQAEGSGGTLLIGSMAIFCANHADMLRVGGSVGRNVKLGGIDGTLDRSRSRGDVTYTLSDVYVDGHYDQDGVAVAAGSRRSNTLTLMRTLANFWDDSCTDRGFTLRLVEGATQYTGTARFEDIGTFVPYGNTPYVVATELMFTVAEGRMTVVP